MLVMIARAAAAMKRLAPVVVGGMVAADSGPHAPADQHGNIDERKIRTEPSRSGKIAWLPGRIEFSLESAQALKIVETPSERPNDATHAMPARRQAMCTKAGERHHPEAEATVALLAEALDKTNKEILHRVARCRAGLMAHQADGHLFFEFGRHHGGEGHRFTILP